MKRLHIVGKSKDDKRLYLAQKKDAKFGSFEIPIGRKLLRLIEEVQAAKAAKDERKRPSKQAPPANRDDPTSVRVLPTGASSADGGAAVRATGPEAAPAAANASARPVQLHVGDDIDIPIASGESPGPAMAPASQAPPAPPAAPLFEPEPAPVAAPAVAPPEQEVEAPVRIRTSRPEPTRRRPEIPAKSKLSPAEIQGLIRAGRGVRSVANMAGTPVAWVKYLAEPIQQERLGIVQQMLVARQERARLGPSSAPIGESILSNLRGKGIRNPEAVLEQGFTAHRPDGREWRVRLVFDHRGSRFSATWSFDPQTREVIPMNPQATRLGWRRQPGADDEEPKPRARPAPRSRSRKTSSRRKKTATRKSSSRRTTTARKSAAKRSRSSTKRAGSKRAGSKRAGSTRARSTRR